MCDISKVSSEIPPNGKSLQEKVVKAIVTSAKLVVLTKMALNSIMTHCLLFDAILESHFEEF